MAKAVKEEQREFEATHRFARISARKARLVVDIIRGSAVEKALQDLSFCQKRASPMVSKVLRSAMANATQVAGLEPEKLYVSAAVVDEGPTLKRWRPRAMGRAYPRLRRTCHIRVAVSEQAETAKAKETKKAERTKTKKHDVDSQGVVDETRAESETPSTETAAGAKDKDRRPAKKKTKKKDRDENRPAR